jgi:hypothetical protein
MRYEKPVVMELNERALSGTGSLACQSGPVVSPTSACNTGSLDVACYAGGGGTFDTADCRAGSDATVGAGSCLSGGTAGYECAAGSSPVYVRSCTVGPSN